MLFRKIAIVDRPNDTTLDLFNIAAVANPFARNAGRPCCNIDMLIRIAPRAARVVNAHRFVRLELAVERFWSAQERFRETERADRRAVFRSRKLCASSEENQ